MASFQVVYDDFSGGQYVGNRPANQPKSTWTGLDVLPNANGELIPGGTRLLGTWAPTASGTINNHIIVDSTGYIFTDAPRMGKYNHTDASATTTFTAYSLTSGTTLTGTLGGVTYSSLHGRFYATSLANTTSGTVWNITTSGTVASFSTAFTSYAPVGIACYKTRLLVWGQNRLFYSGAWTGTQYGAFNQTTQYYEFDSTIDAVYPRTDDLLVICRDGTYSVTGVFGTGINIQLLTPGANVSPGMIYGAVVNRSLFYLDEATAFGNIDGRLYRMLGASQQPIGSFEYGDYDFADNGYSKNQPGIVTAIPNGRIAVQFRTGKTYFETTPGTFARSQVFTITESSTSRAGTGYYRIGETGPLAPDEYILTAVITAPGTNSNISVYRTYTNVPGPTKLDANFNFSTNSTCTVNPSGSVELSEYWHNKPFTVKEVFVEYSITTGGSVSCSIQPTGVVDVPAANLSSVVSTAASETSPPAGGYRMYRYWPNNASKGFGVKPQLTITNCFVKRVILNCED